jgi:hypothetical protein
VLAGLISPSPGPFFCRIRFKKVGATVEKRQPRISAASFGRRRGDVLTAPTTKKHRLWS